MAEMLAFALTLKSLMEVLAALAPAAVGGKLSVMPRIVLPDWTVTAQPVAAGYVARNWAQIALRMLSVYEVTVPDTTSCAARAGVE